MAIVVVVVFHLRQLWKIFRVGFCRACASSFCKICRLRGRRSQYDPRTKEEIFPCISFVTQGTNSSESGATVIDRKKTNRKRTFFSRTK